jgi:hypothetical protein
MSDDLKNIIFNISKEETDAIANAKTDWNEDFFPTSPKAALQKILIMVVATVVLCGIVYSTSTYEDESKAVSTQQADQNSYFNTDEE